MKTFTRRGAARELNTNDINLIYWENQGKLKPEKVKVENTTVIIYTPDLIEKAKKLLYSGKRRKREKK